MPSSQRKLTKRKKIQEQHQEEEEDLEEEQDDQDDEIEVESDEDQVEGTELTQRSGRKKVQCKRSSKEIDRFRNYSDPKRGHCLIPDNLISLNVDQNIAQGL